MAEVRLAKVSKTYDNKVQAVMDVDLTVKNREFLVLVGPSGCGKTTLLRMVAGLEEVTSGDIFIDGQRMNDVQPKDRNVAMVFQNYALYPHMTVFENIAFGLRMAGKDQLTIRDRVNSTAAMLELAELLGRKPKALSGGQRQRVALARAIVKSPQAFLFDEPLSNLDAQLRTQTRAELKKLQQQLGTTAIYVTHDRVEAMTLGDRIAVIKAGRLQQVGEPLAIYHDPDNMFVANFIGTPGINLLDGSLAAAGGRACFVSKGFKVELPQFGRRRIEAGRAVLGIRPEDLSIGQGRGGPAATVELVEQLGGESLIYAALADGTKVVTRTEGNVRLGRGETVRLSIDARLALLFDARTELRIR